MPIEVVDLGPMSLPAVALHAQSGFGPLCWNVDRLVLVSCVRLAEGCHITCDKVCKLSRAVGYEVTLVRKIIDPEILNTSVNVDGTIHSCGLFQKGIKVFLGCPHVLVSEARSMNIG